MLGDINNEIYQSTSSSRFDESKKGPKIILEVFYAEEKKTKEFAGKGREPWNLELREIS